MARNSKNAKASLNLNHPISWKTGDRCMAIWRVDAKYTCSFSFIALISIQLILSQGTIRA